MTEEKIIGKLIDEHSLQIDEYEYLLKMRSPALLKKSALYALDFKKKYYSNKIYLRALLEISNICKNNCLYCGIRKDNKKTERYRLTKEEIINLVKQGYNLGFRTFVLQGGEDGYFDDEILCDILSEIKGIFPDCALTLSLGERSLESYHRLKISGADRYLLREESANPKHYKMLHPDNMRYENRIECLKNLKKEGYLVGCGFMVGSPYQTYKDIANDLKFIETFSPDMCGIGPFIPHKDTPFKDFKSGSVDLTLFLISIIRIIKPDILLPATTSLATLDKFGTEKGILSGANVIMPNLSPMFVRKNYSLYDGKKSDGYQAAENIELLKESMENIGFEVVTGKTDELPFKKVK